MPRSPRASGTPDLDGFDRKILRTIQREGRISVVELSALVGLTATPTQRRLDRLERSGIISGYGARLDRTLLGLGLTVFVQLKIEGHHRESASRLLPRLAAIPEIINCHVVSGDMDLMAEVAVVDLAAYEDLLMNTLLALPGVKEVRSSICLRAVKTAGPLPIEDEAPP